MKTDIELAKSALETAKTGWYRYLATLWFLTLAVFIDVLTGGQFFSDQANISFLNLEVPRIAFSFTYSVLFGTFIIWAAGSAKITREIICDSSDDEMLKALSISSEYRLWSLSPICRSRKRRQAFWLLTGYGLFLLMGITVIHLGNLYLPPDCIMSPALYQGIGVFCAAILVLSVYLIQRRIYPEWNSIYSWFTKDN